MDYTSLSQIILSPSSFLSLLMDGIGSQGESQDSVGLLRRATINLLFFGLLIKLIMINCRCDLPKVRPRFKTNPTEITRNSAEFTSFYKFEAAPTVFLQRLRNGKEIHEAFMRYRKLKKHNYIKELINHKKGSPLTECKKMHTMIVKHEQSKHKDKLNMILESTFSREPDDCELIRRSKFKEYMSCKKDSKEEMAERKCDLSINLKPQAVSLKLKKNQLQQFSMYTSPLKVEITPLELEGTRCHIEDDRKERVTKHFSKEKRQMKATRGSSTFLIDAWKEQKIFASPSFQIKNHYEVDQF